MGSVVVDIRAISGSKSTDRPKRFQFEVRTARSPANLDLFYVTVRVVQRLSRSELPCPRGNTTGFRSELMLVL